MFKIDKNRVARCFGKRAAGYDRETPVQDEMAATLAGQAAVRLVDHPVNRILELGCGTGRMTRMLASRFPEARITALDISPEMIDFARASTIGVNYLIADAEEYLNKVGGKYDLIISNAAVQWFDDVPKFLLRARSCLENHGLLAVSSFGDQTFYELRSAFDYAYAACGIERRQHVVPMQSMENWCSELPEADVTERMVVRNFPDVMAFLRSVQGAGAVNSISGKHFLSRRVLSAMMNYYAKTYLSDDQSRGIGATYHMIYLYCAGESR